MENTKGQSKFVCGNFEVGISLLDDIRKVQPESLLEYILDGITQKLQRKPASDWEKDAAGYKKRPKDFKRNSLLFSEDSAENMASLFGDAVGNVATITVVEYIPNVAESKFTEEKGIVKAKGGDEDRLASLAEAVGYDGEELDEENMEFLAAIRAYLKAERAKAIAGI